MTYFVTAHTNDQARLIVSETRTTDKTIADLVASELERRGFIVSRRQEG